MSKITWDADGSRLFETGVKNGVLYTRDSNNAYSEGFAWSGLTGVTETPSGAESTALYADDMKYLNLISAEELGLSISAYMYPEEFGECDGSAELVTDGGVYIGQQSRKTFGLAYRTEIGNDVDGNDHGYKIHLAYGCLASPSERSYSTINDSPEAITFSWEVKTTPVNVTGFKPTALVTVDSTKATTAKLAALEGILYGADEFSSTKTYAVGDIVEHETGSGSSTVNKLYKCNTAVTTAGTWSESDWTEIALAGPRLPLPDEVKTIMTA